MTRSVGAHCGTHDVVAAILENGNVVAHHRAELQVPFAGQSVLSDAFGVEMGRVLSDMLPDERGSLWLVPPPAFTHLRRVPLEVAGESDRRAQIRWEAAQTLAHSEAGLVIRHWAYGSAAIWEAVSGQLVDRLRTACTAAGVEFEGICSEPIALAQARSRAGEGWHIGIAVSSDWVSLSGGCANTIVLAESDFLDADRHDLPKIAERVAGRIRGRAEPFESLAVAGEGPELTALTELLVSATGLPSMPFDVGSGSQTRDTALTTRIALAVGAARSAWMEATP